jgi:hypothetical protein
MNTNTQRYEVVADYPSSTYKIGDILHSDTENMSAFFGKYPHLFRLLKWWEHVPIDEFPKYVKIRESEIVLKVTDWHTGTIFNGVWGKVVDSNLYNTVYTWWANPATEAEYQEYITKLNSK